MASARDLFGNIKPPVSGLGGGANPSQDLSALLGSIINFMIIITGVTALIYMLWGALSWVTSGGDKEKLQKAQARIRSAVIGIVMSIIVLVIFNAIFSLVFSNSGVITPSNGGFKFSLPTFR